MIIYINLITIHVLLKPQYPENLNTKKKDIHLNKFQVNYTYYDALKI